MKIILTILTAILTTMTISAQTMPPLETGVSQTLAKWRAANYSDVRYKLNITLEKGAPLMKGTIEISVKLTDEGAKNDLILDWRTTQFANDKDKPFADVVSVNGTPATALAMSAKREQTVLYLNAAGNKDRFRADALIAGESPAFQSAEHLIVSKKYLKTGANTININFASPIKTSGSAITRYVDKEDNAEYIYSLFVPSDASTAFPVFDQPDLKARFRLYLDIPKGWNAISNTVGRPSDTAFAGGRQFTLPGTFFDETKPISTYVFAFSAGEFAEVSEPPAVAGGSTSANKNPEELTNPKVKENPPATAGGSDTRTKIYVRKSQTEKFKQHAAEVFRLNREGVKFLESYFDYKFPFPKYDLVLIPEFPFGGMEHAGATFLRESSVIFPTEPTKNDLVSRANVIFHEAAHQWFGDTVTMKWFDDLWLKEGFAEFMAYKTLERVIPEYNAWKIFYERNKQAAYLTDSTKGTTPIYQEIPNLSAAKSAYGNIVYRKAPSFLKQAEFYLGEKEFQIAVRAFLKKHEFANAEWTDLVREFETASNRNLKDWANSWVTKRGMPIFRIKIEKFRKADNELKQWGHPEITLVFSQDDVLKEKNLWIEKLQVLYIYKDGRRRNEAVTFQKGDKELEEFWGIDFEGDATKSSQKNLDPPKFIFPNYQDYGYGIFLLDEQSRAYVLANIQTEKDDFLRAMMWGALWDSVREGELNPKDYVELVVKNINVETDESTIQTILGRVSTAMNYYIASASSPRLSEPQTSVRGTLAADGVKATVKPHADACGSDLCERIETLLIDKMQNAPTVGQRITFYRAFLNIASSEKARIVLKEIFSDDFGFGGGNTKMRPGVMEINGKMVYAASPAIPLKTKDRFDIVTRLLILGDASAPNMLAELEKYESGDEAKRYAYAARAGIGTAANKAKFWNDFTNNREISESYIESAFGAFNSSKHADLTLPYLEKVLAELPNLKKNRKIFFVNGWLSAFIGGQKSEAALQIINRFLADNPNLDKDLRLKILENVDGLERAVKIRAKFAEQAKN